MKPRRDMRQQITGNTSHYCTKWIISNMPLDKGLILKDVTRMNNASAIYAVACQLLLLLHGIFMEL
jgi:hypothetical protein